jgi:hypothetical protein
LLRASGRNVSLWIERRGFAQTAVAYRPAFLSVSGLMLAATLCVTLRREGGVLNKAFAITATFAGFVLSLRILGVM